MKRILRTMLTFRMKLFISKLMYAFFHSRMRRKNLIPTVKGFDDAVNNIVENRMSVSRFGDGEFKWMFQNREEGNFEINSERLADLLSSTLQNKNNNLMICIPNVFSGLLQYNDKASEYWGVCLGLNGLSWAKSLDRNRIYYDTQFTRPYMDYRDKSNAGYKFSRLKQIWENRDVIIVEGNLSRFGVGNDLLDGAKSVKRILAPATNAFESYDQIERSAVRNSSGKKNELFLLSLGPTATILAARLSGMGLQAVDIGHVDIEYSWYLMGAREKTVVKGKYVNEVPDGRENVGYIPSKDESLKYRNEIIEKIGSREGASD